MKTELDWYPVTAQISMRKGKKIYLKRNRKLVNM